AQLSFGQAPTGAISGTVQDASGAVIPNATLTVINKESGATRDVVAGVDGTYHVPSLPAGAYEVKAAVKGFRTTIRPVTVETGAVTTADLRLEVGQTSDVVLVEGASVQVEYS